MASSVHVVGVGSLGAMVASALANLTRPPAVTLILRNQNRMTEYVQNGQILTVINSDNKPVATKILAVVAEDLNSPIANLVVGTKVPQTIPALVKLAPLLNQTSNIFFLQNGMGLYEKLCNQIWKDPDSRPNMLFSTSTHGAKTVVESPFTYHHSSYGDLKVSLVSKSSKDNTENNDLAKILTKTDLNSTLLPYSEFFIAQFEKLVINCCMNAISGVFMCSNNEMLHLEGIDNFLFNIISENITVFKKHLENADIPITVSQRRLDEYYFNVQANLDHIKFLMNRHRLSTTSMVQDIAALRDTEIDNINGYIVDLAAQYEIPAPYNQVFINLVKSKLSLARFRQSQNVAS